MRSTNNNNFYYVVTFDDVHILLDFEKIYKMSILNSNNEKLVYFEYPQIEKYIYHDNDKLQKILNAYINYIKNKQ